MKTIQKFLLVLFLTNKLYAQTSEFKVYPNGLIYSEQAMSKLKRVSDSLNLKYKNCNFDKVFFAKQQTIGHLIELDSGDIISAKKDLENNIGFDSFCKKYPTVEITKNILILRSRYTSYENTEKVEIEHFNLKNDYGFSITSEDLSLMQKSMKNQWLFKYSEKSEYTKERLTAFYFPEEFTSIALPKKYALMVGYSDCLIDTTSTKMKDNLEDGWVELPKNYATLSQKKKEKILDDMRSTRVMGYCSQDSRPRQHAVNIALLSAETYKWDVFLKAHLDIMNDRFDRMSDGSYAYAGRNTYIKEIEELAINVPDLIFGTVFRIENPASNHYYGNVGRLGRALSETSNRSEIEKILLSIVSDTELDLYNRLIFYFLFKNYNYYLSAENGKIENQTKLLEAVRTFPQNIADELNTQKK